MRPGRCATGSHIWTWHEGALPSGPERVRFRAAPRGSILPILVRADVARLAYFVCRPLVAMALGGLFALPFIVGSGLRRRARHPVRCSVYGTLGGALGKYTAGS